MGMAHTSSVHDTPKQVSFGPIPTCCELKMHALEKKQHNRYLYRGTQQGGNGKGRSAEISLLALTRPLPVNEAVSLPAITNQWWHMVVR